MSKVGEVPDSDRQPISNALLIGRGSGHLTDLSKAVAEVFVVGIVLVLPYEAGLARFGWTQIHANVLRKHYRTP